MWPINKYSKNHGYLPVNDKDSFIPEGVYASPETLTYPRLQKHRHPAGIRKFFRFHQAAAFFLSQLLYFMIVEIRGRQYPQENERHNHRLSRIRCGSVGNSRRDQVQRKAGIGDQLEIM